LRQIVAQRDGVVVLDVAGRVQQQQVTTAGSVEQRLPNARVGAELTGIPALELVPPGRFMTEPVAQIVTGCGVASPAGKLEGDW
jgi:hypothetical protein